MAFRSGKDKKADSATEPSGRNSVLEFISRKFVLDFWSLVIELHDNIFALINPLRLY